MVPARTSRMGGINPIAIAHMVTGEEEMHDFTSKDQCAYRYTLSLKPRQKKDGEFATIISINGRFGGRFCDMKVKNVSILVLGAIEAPP